MSQLFFKVLAQEETTGAGINNRRCKLECWRYLHLFLCLIPVAFGGLQLLPQLQQLSVQLLELLIIGRKRFTVRFFVPVVDF